MNYSKEKAWGNIAYSIVTKKGREEDGLTPECILIQQISGQLILETSDEKIITKPGDIMLVRKNQLVKITKAPVGGEDYKIVLVLLSDDILRKYALEQQIEVKQKYKGKHNVFIRKNEFLQAYFASLTPYLDKLQTAKTTKLCLLKVEEAIELLLYLLPELKEFLFDFSEPHKIDLEKFMLRNFRFNVPIEKFARLTGRSLAGFKRDFQKTFNDSPRQWLQNKRLIEAYYQIEKKGRKPSAIYLDLGFESLSHFSNSFKQKFGVTPSELHLG